MDSATQTPSLPDAREIVKTDDPQVLDLAQRILAMTDEARIELRANAASVLRRETERYQQATVEERLVVQITDAVLLRTMVARGARALPHNEYVVELTAAKSIEKRIDVLRKLEGKVPDDELRKALYLTNPQPEWKANASALGTLLRKYGEDSEIGRIIREGLVETYGPPQLVFKEREQAPNVTPALEAVS